MQITSKSRELTVQLVKEPAVNNSLLNSVEGHNGTAKFVCEPNCGISSLDARHTKDSVSARLMLHLSFANQHMTHANSPQIQQYSSSVEYASVSHFE